MRRLILGALSFSVPAMAGANGLLDAYHQAQEQDQTFQAAEHQRDASIEAKPQAWSVLLPQVTGQGSIERDRQHLLHSTSSSQTSTGDVQWFGTRSYSLALNQVIFDWSAFQTVAQSDKEVAQAQATYRSAEQSLI